jgi:hypothetical protein
MDNYLRPLKMEEFPGPLSTRHRHHYRDWNPKASAHISNGKPCIAAR